MVSRGLDGESHQNTAIIRCSTKTSDGFCLCCESIQVCINITDLRGSGCPMSVSCVNTQQVTILSQGVVVLKNCYLDLEVDAMGQRLGFFFFFLKNMMVKF